MVVEVEWFHRLFLNRVDRENARLVVRGVSRNVLLQTGDEDDTDCDDLAMERSNMIKIVLDAAGVLVVPVVVRGNVVDDR